VADDGYQFVPPESFADVEGVPFEPVTHEKWQFGVFD
jgi:hypothetical protein